MNPPITHQDRDDMRTWLTHKGINHQPPQLIDALITLFRNLERTST